MVRRTKHRQHQPARRRRPAHRADVSIDRMYCDGIRIYDNQTSEKRLIET